MKIKYIYKKLSLLLFISTFTTLCDAENNQIHDTEELRSKNDNCRTLNPVSIAESKGKSYSASNQQSVKKSILALTKHIKGVDILTRRQIGQHKSIIERNIDYLGYSQEMIESTMKLIQVYESFYGPFFRNEYTSKLLRSELKKDIHSTLLSVMQGVIDNVYNSKIVDNCTSVLNGAKFKSSKYFPGEVTSIPDPDEVHTAKINGSYEKTFGHLIMHAELPARRPTGTYLAPGDIATVTVPPSLVGKGYQIRVGAHGYDLSKKSKVYRFDRSSIVYNIKNKVTKIASPLGGGIYIEVPYLSKAGVVDINIKNAVRSPYFSMKSFHTTSLAQWKNVERQHGAPWADFQTEKFMLQVPTSWIYNYDDPVALLADWDKATNAVSDLMGYPKIRGKEVLYLQTDVVVRAKAYSPGYPQVNNTYDPDKNYDGNGKGVSLTGPVEMWKMSSVEFHELGHGHKFQKFPGGTESAVNFLYVAVLNKSFGLSLKEAFWKSFKGGHEFKTLDNTAITWMMHKKFKLGQPMSNLEMKYQMRGYARYYEITKLFGWKVLEEYWKSFNQDYERTVSPKNTNPDNNGDYDRSINGLILRLSKKAKVDLTPLLHFWGIHPSNRQDMKKAIAENRLSPSREIYDRLVQYKSIVPPNNKDFRDFVLGWWLEKPKAGTPKAKLWKTWDAGHAVTVKKRVQNIINLYFPNGRP